MYGVIFNNEYIVSILFFKVNKKNITFYHYTIKKHLAGASFLPAELVN